MNQRIFAGLILAATVSAITVSALVEAQTNIEDLQQRPSGTTISGEVVSVAGNNFVLNDGTGQLIVDAGPRWWREIDLSPGEQITVTGELGKGGELDAYSITRSDGTLIEIRFPEGPPPWAGGTNRAGDGSPGPNRPQR